MNHEPILFLVVLLLLVFSPESNARSVRRLQNPSPVLSPSPYLQPSSRRSPAPDALSVRQLQKPSPVPSPPPNLPPSLQPSLRRSPATDTLSVRRPQKPSPVPSPSPSLPPSLQPSSRRSLAPAPVSGIPPTGLSSDTSACLGTCRGSRKITVCVKRSETDSDKLLVFISNSGEISLEVNVTVSDVSYLNEIKIPEQQTKQINITTDLVRNFTVEVDTGDEKCKIPYMVLPAYNDRYFSPGTTTIISHSYGLYLLVILVALIIGGCMARCYKLGEQRRLDGIQYQELEMGQPDSAPADGSVENAGNWEDWDDRWDDPEKPLNRHEKRNAAVTARTT